MTAPSGFQFRPLHAGDQSVLWDILHIALWDPPPAGLRPRAVLDSPGVRIYAEAWGRADDIGVLAQLPDGATPVGACWMRRVPDQQGLAYVNDATPQLGIAILPPWQRQGVGRPLMLAALQAARQAGYRQVSLTVHPQNPAIRMYEACGFRKAGLRNTFHLMVAQLENAGLPAGEVDMPVTQHAHAAGPMQVRPFQRADTAAVVALWQACDLTRPWNDPVRDIARKREVQRELFLVGVCEGVLMASAMAGYDGHRGWVNYLAVHPDWRRQGHGEALMRVVEQRLLALGCPKLNLQVRAGNAAVLDFYRALGYAQDDVVSLGKRLIPDTPASH